MNKPKATGTAAEVEVVKACERAGLKAHRVALAGIHDQGDVHILGGRIVCETKAGQQTRKPSWTQLADWWAETQREAERVPACDIAILITKRWGSGRAEDWWAYTDAATVTLLTTNTAGGPDPSPTVALRLGDLLTLLAGKSHG